MALSELGESGAAGVMQQAPGVSVPGLKAAVLHGGETGRLLGSIDWSKTPFGPLDEWPQSLRVVTSICMLSRFPIVIYWGPELAMIYNDAYISALGDKHPSAMGQPGRVVWAEIWPTIDPMLKGVMAGGEATWSNDLLLEIARYGFPEECYFTFSFSPVRDEHDRVGGIFCAVQETTATVLEQRRLRTLRDIGNSAGQFPSAEDACRQAIEALGRNPADCPFALAYLLGAPGEPARLVGRTSAYGDWPESAQEVWLDGSGDDIWQLRRVADSGQAVVIERMPPSAGGVSGLPHNAFVVPVAQAGQQRPAAILVIGLSPKLRFGTEYATFLELASAKLATAIADATAYAHERRRADELAELDRVKTAFFSNVSHEFRTPLTLMLGPLEELLKEPTLSQADHDRVDMAHHNALRLLKLVNSLLDFSRLQAGRLQATFAPIDLCDLTIELASSFRSAVESAGLKLEVDCQPLPQPTFVDRNLWEQIVLNLLSNAFKFTFEGAIRVRLRDAGDGAELTISDSGVGIPALELPRVFERFHRVPDMRSRTYEGAGIGLALVDEFVRLHGGTIGVESEAGKGTSFRITIPYGSAHLPAEALSSPPQPAGTPSSAFVEESLRWLPEERLTDGAAPSPDVEFRREGRILVADDNADLRAYLEDLLGRHWQVELTANGEEALAKAIANPPDLILADVMMPGLDGFELLKALRSNPKTSLVPVILLTARAGRESAVEGLEAGADDYLGKPFTASELVARVRSNLDLARTRRSLGASERELERLSKLERAKSNLLNLAAHEFRGPVAVVRGYASMLEDGTISSGSPQGRHAVGIVSAKAAEMDRLIRDMIDAAKLEEGQMPLQLAEFDLRRAVERAVEQRRSLVEKSHQLTVDLPDRPVMVRADPKRVEMVVSNLLENAIKYSPEGGPIESEVQLAGSSAVVRIRDHGLGIAPADQPLLFTRFGRIVTPANSHIPGIGLGLYLSREIALLQGGDVTLEQSTPNQGSAFALRLPLASAG